MQTYIEKWYNVIEYMRNTNTYKLVWGKALLDLVILENKESLSFLTISETMLKYYWNQVYFFNLKQGPLNQEPILFQLVEKAIKHYQQVSQSNQPVWFNIALPVLKQDRLFFTTLMKDFASTLVKDVSWRFPKVEDEEVNLYKIEKKKPLFKSEVIFSTEQVAALRADGILLMQFLYFKWTQLLEKFNQSPRIANKVAGSEAQSIRRKSLKMYKDILLTLYENKPIIDFYTGKELKIEDVSVDHFIPWSYIYSDDLWNLVITSKSYNSVKSNKRPSVEFLDKLKLQNKMLLQILEDQGMVASLANSLEHHYLDKFYTDLMY
jgi:hypothetical protein